MELRVLTPLVNYALLIGIQNYKSWRKLNWASQLHPGAKVDSRSCFIQKSQTRCRHHQSVQLREADSIINTNSRQFSGEQGNEGLLTDHKARLRFTRVPKCLADPSEYFAWQGGGLTCRSGKSHARVDHHKSRSRARVKT